MSVERSQQLADSFMRALRACEREGDIEPIVQLFSDRCLVGNVLLHHPFQGKDGARAFWKEYRDSFQEVHSHFNHVNGSGPLMHLEWTSEGVLRNGQPVTYRGVSLLEFDDNRITRFMAYYDSSALVIHAGERSPRDSSSAA
jgi:hypothetical protein